MSFDPKQHWILLVDDEAANRLVIGRRLTQQGYRVATAPGGRAAMVLLKDWRFALVLLDVNMPEMDGLETLNAIKSDPGLQTVPVIMLTAKKTPDAVTHSVSRGAVDYLIKPISPAELSSRVQRCLTRQRTLT